MNGAGYDGMMRTPVAGRLAAAAAPLPPHATTAYRAAFGRHESYDAAGIQWMQVSSPILTYPHLSSPILTYPHVCCSGGRSERGAVAVLLVQGRRYLPPEPGTSLRPHT